MSPCQDTIILETRNISRVVARNGTARKIVDSISYTFKKRNIYNIVGPSGAGKTSFLRLLNRLDEPTGGDILYYDKPLDFYKPTELRKKISLIFQESYMFPGKVGENLSFCCPERAVDDIHFHMERVGLDGNFADADTADLSAGERQRVAIARSLIMNPEILLLDEPTASLDPTSSKTIEKLILSLITDLCLTAIVVTHDPEQAKRMGGQTLLMVEGKLVECGESEKLLTDPKTELARKYIDKELK